MILYVEYLICYYVLMCFLFLLFGICICVVEYFGCGIRIGFIIKGDIIIGGLIFVYFFLNDVLYFGNLLCSGLFYIWGYKGVEVMLYVVNFINDNLKFFFGVIFGVDIKDICGSVNYVIMESLSFDFIRNVFVVLE